MMLRYSYEVTLGCDATLWVVMLAFARLRVDDGAHTSRHGGRRATDGVRHVAVLEL